MKRLRLLASLPALAALLAPGTVLAEGPALNYTQRGLVLPQGKLRIDAGPSDFSFHDSGSSLGFRVAKSPGVSVGGFTYGGGGTSVGLGLGAAYGVIENLDAGVQLLPLIFSPDFTFGDIQLWGRYAFLSGDGFSMGGQVGIQLPTQTQFGMDFSVPVIVKVGDMAKLETGLGLGFVVDPTIATLQLPLAVTIGLMDPLFLGLRTGFVLPDFNFDLFTIPLGAIAGYTIAGGEGGPMLDLTFQWLFPNAFTLFSPGDKATFNVFHIIFGANFYLDLP